MKIKICMRFVKQNIREAIKHEYVTKMKHSQIQNNGPHLLSIMQKITENY